MMNEPLVLTPCRRCGVLPGWDKHVALADHPFDGDLPPAAPSGPWPCCRHCRWLDGPCPTADRHAYQCEDCEAARKRWQSMPPLPPPNPLLGATLDGEPPVPLV